MLVLRAGGPSARGYSELPAGPFLHVFSASTFERPNDLKVTPQRPKVSPKAPKTAQNRSQSHLKSDFSEKVKTIKNHCFYSGLGTLGCPLPDIFTIKMAIV